MDRDKWSKLPGIILILLVIGIAVSILMMLIGPGTGFYCFICFIPSFGLIGGLVEYLRRKFGGTKGL